MSKIVTLIACIFMSFAVSAQNTTAILKGKLVDSTNKQSLKDASITVLDARDSSLEVFGLAKEDGSFSIVNIGFGAMIVQVKFNGYETFTKNITFSASNSTVNLGNIRMIPAANELAGVTVSQSAMRMKGDTTEFNASSFKTKPNAVAMKPDSTANVLDHLLVNNKKDPACGMPVSAGIGDTAHYKNLVLGFCSKECKEAFEKNPEGLIAAAEIKK